MKKEEDAMVSMEHEKDSGDVIEIIEKTKYVLRRGIFGIAFLVKKKVDIDIK